MFNWCLLLHTIQGLKTQKYLQAIFLFYQFLSSILQELLNIASDTWHKNISYFF